MALQSGFLVAEFRANVLGEDVINAFYYGLDTGVGFQDATAVEEMVTVVFDYLFDNPSTAFGVQAYRGLFPTYCNVTGLRVLAKGGVGVPAAQIRTDLNTAGTRSTTSDPLAPNLTYSCYGSRKLSIGRGAKTAFSGAVENDYSGDTGWEDGALLFKRVVDEFLLLAQPVGDILDVDGFYGLVPCVVPRVGYTTSGGDPATRLPTETGDSPAPKPINRMVGGQFAGRQKRRAKKVRGS